jgi:cellulose synthase/poly-beta-1,6-N-acetylglucosamine synthase-like glycosyltransferase
MEIILIVLLSSAVLILSYPVLALVRSLFRKTLSAPPGKVLPPVTIIIAAYNEAKHIEQRIRSFLDKEEWIENSEIIVHTTGSSDNTAAILKTINHSGVLKIITADKQTSKIDAVNYCVSIAKHDLLVFSDCRQSMRKGSIKNMISHFNNSEIGTVVATLIDNSETTQGSFFRKLINRINLSESVHGSCMNVYGALYAQRRSCYRLIPSDILFDDLFVVVSTLQQNKRLVQVPDAAIYDLDFNKYYKKERTQRLARGLLIFLFNHYAMVGALSFRDKSRFLVYKYGKLLLPFIFFAILGIAAIRFIVKMDFAHPGLATVLILVFLLSLGFFSPFRKSVIILWYFLGSTLRFIFFKARSIKWDKLDLYE